MKIGDRVQVRAYRSDGICYRWWYATVEAVEPQRVILITPVGHRVEDVDGGWASRHAIRSYYWLDRPYSLLEVYSHEGSLVEIYVNVNSPAEMEDSLIKYTDYELDVSRQPPHAARIVDEDEFREAAGRYAYSDEFQNACYEVAKEAMALADRWVAKGIPAI